MHAGIKVFAPASIGNVAVGFDVLGMAIERPGDEIIVRLSDQKGLRITQITGAKGKLPLAVEKNTAGFAALKLLEHLGMSDRGIEMEIHKKMPLGSGLGSSAASAVAGVFAVSELLKTGLSKRDLLPFALEGEELASGSKHADNVAPSLLGGIVLCCGHEPLDVHRLPAPKGLYVTVVYPHVEVLTKNARNILKLDVPLKDAVQQMGHLGGFIVGLYKTDFDLLGRSLKDLLIEPQRARLIPHFYEVKDAALDCGVLGCSISGAGPSIFALSANSLLAEQAGIAMQRVFHLHKIECDLYLSAVNQEGVVLC